MIRLFHMLPIATHLNSRPAKDMHQAGMARDASIIHKSHQA